jgi:hypothetical protein
LLDLVLHVPTNSLGHVPCAVVRAARPATPAREYFIVLVVVAGVGIGYWWCREGCCVVFTVEALGVAGRRAAQTLAVVVAMLLPK